MNTPTPEEVQCDALRMLSRSLDGDLTRAETRQLYHHLASCESCRVRMGQMAALASDLEELSRQYAGQSLGATFAEKVLQAVPNVEPEQPAQAPPRASCISRRVFTCMRCSSTQHTITSNGPTRNCSRRGDTHSVWWCTRKTNARTTSD